MATKKKVTKAAKPAVKGKKPRSGAVFKKTIEAPAGTEHIEIHIKVRCKKGKPCCVKTVSFSMSPIEPEGPDGDGGKSKKLMLAGGGSPIEPEGPDG